LRWLVDFSSNTNGDDASVLKALRKVLAPLGSYETMPDWEDGIDVPALRSALRDALHSLVDDGESKAGVMWPRLAIEKMASRPVKPTDPVLLIVSGSVRDVVLEMFFHLIQRVAVERIRRCPGLDCGRLFVRVGRQTHCTTTCYDRSHWATLPAKTVRAYRKKQYDKYNWTLGARSQRIATEGKTRGKKAPQVPKAGTKNARHS